MTNRRIHSSGSGAFPRKTRGVGPSPTLFIFGFSMCWAVAVTALIYIQTIGLRDALTARALSVIVITFAGSFIASLLSFAAAKLLTLRRPQKSARFAAMFICLAVGTCGVTALLFLLQFRLYYAQWHSDQLSSHMLREILFTAASSTYIYAVLITRQLLPWGLPLLVIASWIYAKAQKYARNALAH